MLRRSLTPKVGRTAGALAGLVLASVLVVGCRESAPARTQASTVVGVGGTFPAPLYTHWAQQYRAVSGVSVNYQGVGSGGGIKQILAKTADFGASDIPMSTSQLDRAGLYQFPIVVGAVTPVVNLPGVGAGQLKLTGPLVGDIYLGDVTRWNDPRIAALNPGLKLPALPISVVHRQYPSGSTFIFTSYLSLVDPAWKAKVGAGDAVAWPTGVVGWGNGGIAGAVQQTPGAIGYVEYAYARQAGLAYVRLQNRDGVFVAPGADSFAAAAARADWGKSPGNDVMLVDEPGAGAWPITGATYVLIYKQPAAPAKAKQVLAFFDWAYKTGDATATGLDFVPLPQSAKDMVRRQWASTVKDASAQPVFTSASH